MNFVSEYFRLIQPYKQHGRIPSGVLVVSVNVSVDELTLDTPQSINISVFISQNLHQISNLFVLFQSWDILSLYEKSVDMKLIPVIIKLRDFTTLFVLRREK
jgi:hypothetical protein